MSVRCPRTAPRAEAKAQRSAGKMQTELRNASRERTAAGRGRAEPWKCETRAFLGCRAEAPLPPQAPQGRGTASLQPFSWRVSAETSSDSRQGLELAKKPEITELKEHLIK